MKDANSIDITLSHTRMTVTVSHTCVSSNNRTSLIEREKHIILSVIIMVGYPVSAFSIWEHQSDIDIVERHMAATSTQPLHNYIHMIMIATRKYINFLGQCRWFVVDVQRNDHFVVCLPVCRSAGHIITLITRSLSIMAKTHKFALSVATQTQTHSIRL